MTYYEIVKIGGKGEIYTSKKIRLESGLKPGYYARVAVEDGLIIVRPIRKIEDLIKDPVDSITIKEAEELSLAAQKEAKIYG